MCPFAVWWVPCPVSRVALSLHEPFVWSRGRGRSRRDSSHSPSARVRSWRSRRVCSCSSGCHGAWRDRSRSHSSGYGVGRLSPLTVCGHVIEVGGLGRVAGIARRLLWPPGIATLWVEGGVCPCNGGQLHLPAHAFFTGPRQAVPQPVWSHAQWDAVVGSMFLAAGISGDICSPLCVFVCECSRSGCGFSHWCCLCDRFGRSRRACYGVSLLRAALQELV